MSLTATYDDPTGKVTLVVAGAPGGTTFAHLQRSPDQVTWTDVRGGQAVAVSSGGTTFLDYEYSAGMINYYRATYTPSGSVDTTSLTVAQTAIWLKNPLRPFLNRVVKLVGPLDTVSRNSRSGVFDIIARTDPVAVTDLMSGLVTSYTLDTRTRDEVVDLDLMLAVGEVLLFQPPGASNLETIYALPGSPSRSIFTENSPRRFTTLPLAEVALPDLTLAAVQSTYQTVLNTYATYQALLDAKATYQDVLLLVGTANDVITG